MLSLAGITVAKCSRITSSCSRSAVSMSMNWTPCASSFSFDLVVDDLGLVLGADAGEELRSASGMPSLSKVFLMSSGTSSQFVSACSEARTK